MWYPIIVLCYLPFIFGFDKSAIKLAIDYFEHRNVKFICLLGCHEHLTWNLDFTRAAINKLAVSNVNIADSLNNLKIQKCFRQSLTSVGVLVNPKCVMQEDIFYYVSQNMWFDQMHIWLFIDDNHRYNEKIFTKSYDFNNIEGHFNDYEQEINLNVKNETIENNFQFKAILANLNISVDADITLATQTEPTTYDLYEIYNFGEIQGGDLVIEKVGAWNFNTGIKTKLNGYKYYRRWNFQQWSMRMMVVISTPPKKFRPEIILGRNLSPGVPVITKTSAMILNEVAEIHNFRFNYTIADRWIGDFTRNNSKVVATSLYYREHDLSPVIRFMLEINDKIDIVHPPLTHIETRYYYRIPTHGPGKLENQFLRPLTTGVWYCVITTITLCALILLLLASLERRPFSVQYAVFSVFASLCQQFFEDGAENEIRRSFSARKITVLVTGICCLLIYNYYTSSVVSWLLSGPPPSINSLEELLESPLQLVFEDIGYTRSWLQTPSYYYNRRNAKVEDELRQSKVFNKKKGEPILLPFEEGLELLKTGGWAFHTEVDRANMHISRKFSPTELCELGSLQSMEKTHLYPAIQKNSPYKEFLVWSLARLSERGIVSCIQRRTMSPSVVCEGSLPRALALGGAAPAFVLLAAGYLLATIIMLLERLQYKTKSTNASRRWLPHKVFWKNRDAK